MNELQIIVTKINNRYHSRLIVKDKVIDEMACLLKEDVGYICREMLCWYDKMFGDNQQASCSRNRRSLKNEIQPLGKIWYMNKLNDEKERLAAKKV